MCLGIEVNNLVSDNFVLSLLLYINFTFINITFVLSLGPFLL